MSEETKVRTITGRVVSNKMEKTIVVSIENRITHKKYGKVIAKTKKYKVHDEENQCQIDCPTHEPYLVSHWK